MLKRKLLFISLIACFALMLSGCWNRREMNELAINMGLGIDKIGDGYRITAQVVVPREVATRYGGGGGQSPVTVYQSSGKTIYEALRRITGESPRRLYLSHLRVLILGESLAKEGFAPVLDFLSRNHEMRTDFFIVVAKASPAEDILKVLTPIEEVPANKLFTSLSESGKAWAPTLTVTLDRLLNDLVREGRNPVLTAVRMVGTMTNNLKNIATTEPDARIKYAGLAVFKKDKLIGWLDESDSKGYSYITDKVETTVGPITCPEGGLMNLETVRSKTKMTARVVEGHPEITIEIRSEGNIGEVQCEVDLTKPETIDQLEQIAKERLQQIVKHTLAAAQTTYKSDIFGFGDTIRRSNPKDWDRIKEDWDRLFPGTTVHVKTDFQIRRVGTVSNSIFQQMKE
ncbi:Ger(x)C family spore germination protein [Paenibacillus sedimenti]|uniref:Ger(X)C family spore germination protein n=1 Tax=Paenibacillus sedimenti TaxID=2770274 RepID=A0A926KU58_9BACL|nr:Ger(x)C family spore germination protein [Paenibacillus sedimenti]MBD0382298.1 Ger(x)C family spore germination protein [Paenibacillus sedimenti]